jgi:hypothetical protein
MGVDLIWYDIDKLGYTTERNTEIDLDYLCNYNGFTWAFYNYVTNPNRTDVFESVLSWEYIYSFKEKLAIYFANHYSTVANKKDGWIYEPSWHEIVPDETDESWDEHYNKVIDAFDRLDKEFTKDKKLKIWCC